MSTLPSALRELRNPDKQEDAEDCDQHGFFGDSFKAHIPPFSPQPPNVNHA